MTRTPEEIKKGLECCYGMVCGTIKVDCPYEGMRDCHDIVLRDALAYIKQLEAERNELDYTLAEVIARMTV